jgi:hypothetical protein
MRDLAILFIHLLATVAKLMSPGALVQSSQSRCSSNISS